MLLPRYEADTWKDKRLESRRLLHRRWFDRSKLAGGWKGGHRVSVLLGMLGFVIIYRMHMGSSDDIEGKERTVSRRFVLAADTIQVVGPSVAATSTSEATATGTPTSADAGSEEPLTKTDRAHAGTEDNEENEQTPMKASFGEEPWVESTRDQVPIQISEEKDASTNEAEYASSQSSAGQHMMTAAEKAVFHPDVIHVPFEDAVKDEILDGWEDEWFSEVSFDADKWGSLQEPLIDFLYLWVNGSDPRFQESKKVYELNSPLNDPKGLWISHHSVNRYRDWDELRYSMRSLEKYTGSWKNTIQLLVNSVPDADGRLVKQSPAWLKRKKYRPRDVRIVAQEEMFDLDKQSCLPTFNSLTIENQIFNIESNTDHFFALSDDMLLGKPHAASDFYSPLFGPSFAFKTNSYNTRSAPTDADAARFGEKPYLLYTSWLLNRRFGGRKRKGQAHFGHSLSRSVMREAMSSFPRPELESACQRFRGEQKWQIYSWYAAFHYTVERHREVLLWSYLLHRADPDGDGILDWEERQVILHSLEAGMANEGATTFRKRNFYHVEQYHDTAGLEPPRVNTAIQWTSLDGPVAIHDLECASFDVDECLAPGFGMPDRHPRHEGLLRSRNPVFSTAAIFERVARGQPECGDCLLKILLNQQQSGFGPVLPNPDFQADARAVVLKALKRYQYTVVDQDALFVMVTDAEQVQQTLLKRFTSPDKAVGQLCLNDDVASDDPDDLDDVRRVMTKLYQILLPKKSAYEK